jgi:hypothetical protein
VADFRSARVGLIRLESLNIAITQRHRHLPATAARNHARVLVNGAAPGWEMLIAAVPATHREEEGNVDSGQLALDGFAAGGVRRHAIAVNKTNSSLTTSALIMFSLRGTASLWPVSG